MLKDVAYYPKDRISSKELNSSNYVGVDNLLKNKRGKRDANVEIKPGNYLRYQAGDILIGNIRPYLKKIWLADREGGTNGDVVVIRPIVEKVFPEYLYYCLANDRFFDFDVKHSRGAKMPRGDKKAILQFPIRVPDLEKQKKIAQNLNQMDTLVQNLIKEFNQQIELVESIYNCYLNDLLAFNEKEFV